MNTDRLLREVEKRLVDQPAALRTEILDALREELARERRRLALEGTVEAERERRAEAETLREVLEAINRQARLDETVDEILKQLARLLVFDSCLVALLDPGDRFRIIATRGFPEPARFLNLRFSDPLSQDMRSSPRAIVLADVRDDIRFVDTLGTGLIRSWAAIPLLVEGDLIGMICLDRHRVEPFDDDDIHRAKAVAFSAAAAIRKAQLQDQLKRYASLMERVVEIDQAVFAGKSVSEIAKVILDGAARIGSHDAGLLILAKDGVHTVAATTGPFQPLLGKPAPPAFVVAVASRLSPSEASALGQSLGLSLPDSDVYLVPLLAKDGPIGSLALIDPDGDTPDDRLMEAYASRAATAYLHVLR